MFHKIFFPSPFLSQVLNRHLEGEGITIGSGRQGTFPRQGTRGGHLWVLWGGAGKGPLDPSPKIYIEEKRMFLQWSFTEEFKTNFQL